MNSTFKVVFNKARGALMVVNEVTSSVQAKGTKMVVATAVAAMIAGVAGTAMATTTANITGSLEITADGSIATDVTTDAAGTKWNKTSDSLTAGTDVVLKGGLLDIKTDTTVKSISASLLNEGNAVKITGKAGAAAGDVTLTVGTDAVVIGGDDEKISLTFDNIVSGTGTNVGKTTLTSAANKNLTLGSEDVADNAYAGDVSVTVTKNADALIQVAGTGALGLYNVAIQNDGKLTLKGATVAFNSDYNGDTNDGKLIVDGTTTVANAVKDGIILVGDDLADAATQKTVDTQFKGLTTVVGKTASITADTLYVNAFDAEDSTVDLTVGSATKAGLVVASKASIAGDVVIAEKGAVQATALTMQGGSIEVKGSGTTLGENLLQGILTGDTLVVEGENSIDNTGLVAYKTVNVVIANTSTAADATLEVTNISTSEGFVSFETLNVSSAATGADAEVTLTGDVDAYDADDAAEGKQAYDFVLGSVNVGAGGTVNLVDGVTHITGELALNKDGVLAATAGTLVLDNGLTLAANTTLNDVYAASLVNADKDVTFTANDVVLTGADKSSSNAGDIEVNSLDVTGVFANAGTVVTTEGLTLTAGEFTNGASGEVTVGDGLAVKAGTLTNAGELTVTAGGVTMTGGKFVNQALAGSTEGTVDQNLTVTGDFSVAKAEFDNEGLMSIDGKVAVGENGVFKTLLKTGATDKTGLVMTNVDSISVGKNGVFEVKAFNAASTTGGANDYLSLGTDLTLNGGSIAVTGKDMSAVDVVTTAAVAVEGGSTLTLKSLKLNDAGASLTVGNDGVGVGAVASVGTVVVNTLDQAVAGAAITVANGTLSITDHFYPESRLIEA